MVENDYSKNTRVLVTADLSIPGWKRLRPPKLLSSVNVVLLGLWPVPDQTPPELARKQLGERGQRRLDELEKRFRQVGVSVETRLVFGMDPKKAIDSVAQKENCTAILTWNEQMTVDRVGVFLRADEGRDNIVNNLVPLMAEKEQEVELIHFVTDDPEDDEVESRTTLEVERDQLIDQGLDEEQISVRVESVDDVDRALEETAGDYDAIVMGATQPTVPSKIFGTRHELVQEHSAGPVLVVQYPEND